MIFLWQTNTSFEKKIELHGIFASGMITDGQCPIVSKLRKCILSCRAIMEGSMVLIKPVAQLEDLFKRGGYFKHRD